MTAVAPVVASLGASKQAVQHHYDLSNDFYGLWLDETRTYSCAMWSANESLREAQERKLRYHIESANAAHARRVLDIGCGWGSLLNMLAGEAEVTHAVGLTLSHAQAQWIEQHRHSPNIQVALESWSDHRPTEKYDAIISIGAFEHFARPELDETAAIEAYRSFFAQCHGWMATGGRMSLQTIAYGTATRADLNRFIIEKIFPESDLPTLASIDRAAHGLFEITAVRNDRLDYERTLREWLFALRRRKAEAVEIVGRENVIILHGKNHYPQDIERTIEASHPALKPAGGAAFTVDMQGETRLCVVHEVERQAVRSVDESELHGIARAAVARVHNLRLEQLVLVVPGAIPKTSSGKIRRSACRELYLTGRLGSHSIRNRMRQPDSSVSLPHGHSMERA